VKGNMGKKKSEKETRLQRDSMAGTVSTKKTEASPIKSMKRSNSGVWKVTEADRKAGGATVKNQAGMNDEKKDYKKKQRMRNPSEKLDDRGVMDLDESSGSNGKRKGEVINLMTPDVDSDIQVSKSHRRSPRKRYKEPFGVEEILPSKKPKPSSASTRVHIVDLTTDDAISKPDLIKSPEKTMGHRRNRRSAESSKEADVMPDASEGNADCSFDSEWHTGIPPLTNPIEVDANNSNNIHKILEGSVQKDPNDVVGTSGLDFPIAGTSADICIVTDDMHIQRKDCESENLRVNRHRLQISER